MLVWIMTVMFVSHYRIVGAQYGTCLMLILLVPRICTWQLDFLKALHLYLV